MGKPPPVEIIAFDADDTLWRHEEVFRLTQDRFLDLLADYAARETLRTNLETAEQRNLGHYGFGVKGFVLSMIESAIEVTEDRVPAAVIRQLIEAGQEMLSHPIELLPHARETVEEVAEGRHVILITKGDLLDQERKLAQSGLGELFDEVQIVSDKTPQTYARIFGRHGRGAEAAMMVGNSVRSDVAPALEAGAWGVHVPQAIIWTYEQQAAPESHTRFHEIAHLGELPALLERL